MNAERNPGSAGYVPRLLAAAAFLTRRATEESLAELRLTQERTTILGILARTPADEAALSEASGLAAGCVSDCVLALQCCGYATTDPAGIWTITPAGEDIQARADEAEARLLSPGNDDVDDGLRQELQALITALTPPPGSAPRS